MILTDGDRLAGFIASVLVGFQRSGGGRLAVARLPDLVLDLGGIFAA